MRGDAEDVSFVEADTLLKDGLEIFYIGKRKFCVHVQTNRVMLYGYIQKDFQSVSVTEERRLHGMAWDGTKSWFRNVSKDMKQQAVNQYKLITSFNI